MNDSRKLERRYRRLLSLYPSKFRQYRTEEMVSVLMSGASENQRWPRPKEVANLARNAAPTRLRQGPPPESPARRYPRAIIAFRVLLGIWLLVATVILCQYSLWGLTVLLAEALNIYLAARAYVFMHDEPRRGGSQPPGTLSQSR